MAIELRINDTSGKWNDHDALEVLKLLFYNDLEILANQTKKKLKDTLLLISKWSAQEIGQQRIHLCKTSAQELFLKLQYSDFIVNILNKQKLVYLVDKSAGANEKVIYLIFQNINDFEQVSLLKELNHVNSYYNQYGYWCQNVSKIEALMSNLALMNTDKNTFGFNEHIDDKWSILIENEQMQEQDRDFFDKLMELYLDNHTGAINKHCEQYRHINKKVANMIILNLPSDILTKGSKRRENYRHYPDHPLLINYVIDHLASNRKKIKADDIANAYIKIYDCVNIDGEIYIGSKDQEKIPLYENLHNKKTSSYNFANDLAKLISNLETNLAQRGFGHINVIEYNSSHHGEVVKQIKSIAPIYQFKAHNYLVYKNTVFDCQVDRNRVSDMMQWHVSQNQIDNYQKLRADLKTNQQFLIHHLGRDYVRFNENDNNHLMAKQRIDDFFNQIFNNDQIKIDIYMQFIAYGWLANTDMRQALILKGTGKNGKSTLVNMTKLFLNQEHLSDLRLDQLKNEFDKTQLQHKVLNFDTEGPQFLEEGVEIWKSLIAGDDINTNVKFEDIRTFKSLITMIIATNNDLKFKQYSPAIADRLFFIELVNRFDQHKEKTSNQLKNEIFGVVKDNSEQTRINRLATFAYFDKLMLDAITKVIQNNNHPDYHENHGQIINNFEQESNQVFAWLNEEKHLIKNYQTKLITYDAEFIKNINHQSVNDFYDQFKAWYIDQNGSDKGIYHKKNFTKSFSQYVPVKIVYQENLDQDSGRRVRVYQIDEDRYLAMTGSTFVALVK